MTYQSIPVISGYGNKVYYPEVRAGWDYNWGPEYTSMPELENSLIYYDDSYDSGELAQYLNSKDEYSPESQFGGKFENNYVDNLLISNPYASNTYNFSQMYDPGVHNEQNSTGFYNYYDPSGGSNPAQYIFLENELTNIATNGTTTLNVYESGTLPESVSVEYLEDTEHEYPIIGGVPKWRGTTIGSLSNTYYDDSNFITLTPSGYRMGIPPNDYTVDWINCEFYINTTLPDYNGDDFYLSFTAQMESGGAGDLKVNGVTIGGSDQTSWDLNRVLISNVNRISLVATDDYDAYVYYFMLERIEGSSELMQSPSITETKDALLNWSRYLTTPMDSDGEFGIEFTYKLPVISRDSLDSIQIAFDASLNSRTFEGGNYPLSVQIWNFDQQQWESIPLTSIDGSNTYEETKLDYDFWTWVPEGWSLGPDDAFRPDWSTLGFNRTNTISYGSTFPHTFDASGNIVFNDSLVAGGNFMINNDTDHQLNSLYSDKGKTLFYDKQYNLHLDEINTNKFQLQNLVIDPSNFYTSSETFPDYKTTEGFSKYTLETDFYDYFVNDLHEIKIQIITERETAQSDTDDAHLCVGSFNTYALTTTNYLNYDDFESNMINGEHISDKIVLTSNGAQLYGYSGFNVKDTPQTVKFKDNFLTSTWNLEGVSQSSMDFQKSLEADAYVRSLHPDENYDTEYPLSAWSRWDATTYSNR
jgi:hypothetical protein